LKNYLPVLLLAILMTTAYGQDRREAWLRINLIHWYKPTKAIGLEFHQRMQANFRTDDNNIFHYPSVTLLRPWLYWKLNKNWIFWYSPLSYHGFTTIKNTAGVTDTYTELRTTLGIQRNYLLGKATNRNRAWYEFRFIDVGGDAYRFATRLRIQNTFIIPLWKPSAKTQLAYQLSNEFLWAVQSGYVGFDHNRFYNALQWRVGKQEINLGYQWSLHKSGTDLYDRSQLFLNSSFEL
jgi:hypothetical protein